LFYLLTWKLFRIGDRATQADDQEEKLANFFAGSLLVPPEPLRLSVASHRNGKKSLQPDGCRLYFCALSDRDAVEDASRG
jgi:hypothetical protein